MKHFSPLATLLVLLLGLIAPSSASARLHHGVSVTIPAPAAAVGYNTITYQVGVGTANAFSSSTIDESHTDNAGFKLYFLNWFGFSPTPGAFSIQGDNTVVEAYNSTNGSSGAGGLTTAAAIAGSPYFRGTAFGGGFYACATFKLLSGTVNTTNGWPAWWGFGVEHVQATNGGTSYDIWTGAAANYEHWGEIDFLEYFGTGFGDNANDYYITNHDWGGVYNVTCSPYCDYAPSYGSDAPGSSSFASYHQYCDLWIPATGSSSGVTKAYYDGTLVDTRTSWSQFLNNGSQLPPPTSQPYLYGIFDLDHMALVIGGSPDVNMQIQQIIVYQASAVNNLTNP